MLLQPVLDDAEKKPAAKSAAKRDAQTAEATDESRLTSF